MHTTTNDRAMLERWGNVLEIYPADDESDESFRQRILDKINRENRVTRFIDIGQIRMDRYPLNPSTLSLVKFIQQNGLQKRLPPIKVSSLPGGGYQIKDGRHRVTALKLLGYRQIEATFSTVTLRRKYEDAYCSVCPKHGAYTSIGNKRYKFDGENYVNINCNHRR